MDGQIDGDTVDRQIDELRKVWMGFD